MFDLAAKTEAVFGSHVELPDTPKGMTEAEWLTRLELAACYRLVDHYGWTSIVYNHISLRVPGTNEFLINPFGLRYDEIKASDLIRIDIALLVILGIAALTLFRVVAAVANWIRSQEIAIQ